MFLRSEVQTLGHQALPIGPHLQVSGGGLHQHLPQPQQQEEERGLGRAAEGNPTGSGKRLEYQQLTATITFTWNST